MKNKTKIVSVILLIFVCVICFGCKNENKEDIEPTIKAPRITKHDDVLLASGKAMEGDNCYVIGSGVATRPHIIPSIYAVEVHYEISFATLGKRDTGYLVFQTEITDLYFTIYSIESGEQLKSIDVKAILQKNCPELQVAATYFNIGVHQRKPCMIFALEKHPDSFEDGLEDTLQDAYLSIDTEELFIVEGSESNKQLPTLIQEISIFDDSNYSLFEINGMEDVYVCLTAWEGCCRVSMPITSLPKENKRLYTVFPNLKKELETINQRGWSGEEEVPNIRIYLTGHPTSEEIIGLFIPEGQEISFEGMKISKKSSIDGEEHDIHSFEEYQQLMEPYEELDESERYPIFRNE